jgi:hypothetical protein
MNKTIYLRDEEEPIWNRARELSGEKLSPIIVSALKRFIAEKDAEVKNFERIELRFNDARDHNKPKAKAFYGRWIFSPTEPKSVTREEREYYDNYAVAITIKGGAVVYSWSADRESCWAYQLRIYSCLEEAAEDPEVNYAAVSALTKLGVPVEELDI